MNVVTRALVDRRGSGGSRATCHCFDRSARARGTGIADVRKPNAWGARCFTRMMIRVKAKEPPWSELGDWVRRDRRMATTIAWKIHEISERRRSSSTLTDPQYRPSPGLLHRS